MVKMGIGTNTENPDAGEIKGRQEDIACYVWFTASGRIMPKMVKYIDREGMYQQLEHITVLHQEHKFYCGIETIEFECETYSGNRLVTFSLHYYKERNEWKIIWKD